MEFPAKTIQFVQILYDKRFFNITTSRQKNQHTREIISARKTSHKKLFMFFIHSRCDLFQTVVTEAGKTRPCVLHALQGFKKRETLTLDPPTEKDRITFVRGTPEPATKQHNLSETLESALPKMRCVEGTQQCIRTRRSPPPPPALQGEK